jgi:hypothetical protein
MRFGGLTAVDNLSFNVAADEITAIIIASLDFTSRPLGISKWSTQMGRRFRLNA